MNLPKPTDNNNTIKADTYDKKEKINPIQFHIFEKHLKNKFLEETLVKGSTGHRNSWL